MESPRKFNDCYFYYYSTCTKGDNCVFRHEPAALGCETMCAAWQQGKCLDKKCRLRHMELRKNRKQIPCYWENQPGGCRKKHCPFMHKNPDMRTDGIAPAQPGGHHTVTAHRSVVPESVEALGGPAGVAPVPLLWQQQRQGHTGPLPVVLDSAILGVLPSSSELMGGRRPVHEPPAAYAAMPVDPLVVNFEEESDNESAPSSTPTKIDTNSEDFQTPNSKTQELLLLEKIQAEAAAYYNYDEITSTKERKLVKANLNTKFDRSLDEITGKKAADKSLDFKILSLDEIRARKKPVAVVEVIPPNPITLNLNRKRKLSTQETIVDSSNKIIKVVRSNSVVYRKVDKNVSNQNKSEQKTDDNASRKRTMSEQSDVYEVQETELEDNCFQFKKVKIDQAPFKPKLIRNKSVNSDTSTKTDPKDLIEDIYRNCESTEMCPKENDPIDWDVIEIEDSSKVSEVVDLSDDEDDDIELVENIPDVVASCRKDTVQSNTDKDVLGSIDALLNEEL